jgi:predicted acyltransferase
VDTNQRTPTPEGVSKPTARIASVDALRGMTVAAMLLVNNAGDWDHVFAPLEHSAWNGCTPTDLVFPFFLVIAGVSLSLATGARWARGEAGGRLLPPLLLRAGRVILLGVALHALAWWLMDKPHFRPMGVLQRIGLCVAGAATVGSAWRSERGRWMVLASLLLGYGALMSLGGGWAPGANLAARVDSLVFGHGNYEWDAARGTGSDPEGLLSTLGALGSVVLGLIVGERLRQGRGCSLWPIGGVLLLLGAVGTAWMPWNKPLWTPSFVLWTGGWACLALAAAHEWVDRRGGRPWGRAFGVNAIGAYAVAWGVAVCLAGFGWMPPLYRTVFGPLGRVVGPDGQSLAFALVFVAMFAAFVRWLDRRGWYWKV